MNKYLFYGHTYRPSCQVAWNPSSLHTIRYYFMYMSIYLFISFLLYAQTILKLRFQLIFINTCSLKPPFYFRLRCTSICSKSLNYVLSKCFRLIFRIISFDFDVIFIFIYSIYLRTIKSQHRIFFWIVFDLFVTRYSSFVSNPVFGNLIIIY